MFEHELLKRVWSGLSLQVAVPPYRLDFSIKKRSRMIGFECDGEEFHLDAERDLERDIYILKTYPIDVIYRAWGRDIYTNVHDVLDLLEIREPGIFGGDARKVFAAFATRFRTHEDHVHIPERLAMHCDITRTFRYEEKGDDGEPLPPRPGQVTLRWISREQISEVEERLKSKSVGTSPKNSVEL